MRETWRGYFEEQLSVKKENYTEEELLVEGVIGEISQREVEETLKCVKNGRAGGPSGVSSELLKLAGASEIDELLMIYYEIISDCRVLEQSTVTLTVAIFKCKGFPLQCNKHRGLRLLEHSMIVFEKIVEGRLRSVTHTMDGQCGFMPGNSSVDAIFIIQKMQEKYLEKRKKLYYGF